jgi:hypothetical protein
LLTTLNQRSTIPGNSWQFLAISEYEWNTSGVKLLGGLIGEKDFVHMKVREKVTKVKSLVDNVLEMKDPHRQLTLMRMCLSG